MPETTNEPWAFAEQDNLQHWLTQFRHLSWKAKSEEYYKQTGHRRCPVSLRGKYFQLQRGCGRGEP
ncbi:hypothetical protein N7490_006271 [Penicillium lividum]|nr:hypothetical protein N7490_006271 [Penicillium lividum]